MNLKKQYESEIEINPGKTYSLADYTIWLENKLKPFQYLTLIDPQPPAGATFPFGSVGKLEAVRIEGKWYWSRKESGT